MEIQSNSSPPMGPEASSPLRRGIAAAIGEDFDLARRFLWQAATVDPYDEMAWLWLAKVAETTEERQLCLARAVVLVPENETARQNLLDSQGETGRRALPRARGACPICQLPWADEPAVCARCWCRLNLEDPAAFLQPSEVNRKVVCGELERLQEVSLREVEGHRHLALARLNLGELIEALPHLEKLVVGSSVSNAAEMLRLVREHLDGIEIESGFETDIIDRPTREELGLDRVESGGSDN